MKTNNPRVAFVYAPFGFSYYPAIGVSLLKAALSRISIESDIHYLNLVLAKDLGLEMYETIARIAPHLLLGDWLAASSLFGEDSSADHAYVTEVLWKEMPEVFTPDMILQLYRIRDRLPSFFDQWVEQVDWSRYTWVGFSSICHQHAASLALARRIKSRYPDIRILFGGPSCFGVMGEVLPEIFPFIDYVCTGEGDYAVPRLIQAVSEGEQDPQIPGIVSRNSSPALREKVPPAIINDLDRLPYPDYTDYQKYLSDLGFLSLSDTQVPIETSRGCWWGERCQCTFCGYNGAGITYRSKSSDRAFEEIRYLSATYGKNLSFVDNIFDTRYFQDLIPRIATIQGLSMFLEVKSNLSKDQMRALADAGFLNIHAGIESLSTPILQLMHKGTIAVQNLQVLKWARELGIYLRWNILYGFPGEDPAEYEKMFDLMSIITHLQPPNLALRLKFSRFSEYQKNPAAFGITSLSPKKVYSFIYPGVSPEHLERFCYLFDATYHDISPSYERKLKDMMISWRAYPDARLDLTRSEGSIQITDTRKAGIARHFFYHGIAAALYLWCDTARSYQSIQARFSDHADELEPLLDTFIRNNLMIRSDSTYLSLAVIRDSSGDQIRFPCSPEGA